MFVAPERKNIMGLKFCPRCREIVLTKVLPTTCPQKGYRGVAVKRRQIGHLVEDGGCGHTWYTAEIPEDSFPDKTW
jgi:hypothetical protein